MKINKLALLLALGIGNSFAMDPNQSPNPYQGYGYNPYGYYQPYDPNFGYQNPYGYPPAAAQPAGYGYQQPYNVQPVVPAAQPQEDEDLVWQTPQMHHQPYPAAAKPAAIPAAVAGAQSSQSQGHSDDESVTPAAAVTQASAGATDAITDDEDYHLKMLNENLEKIAAGLVKMGIAYAGAGIYAVTLQLGEAAGEAILATGKNTVKVFEIIHWIHKANEHFDALSKPGVSKAAQDERNRIAPTLKKLNEKFGVAISPIKKLKAKFFGKKGKKDKKGDA